MKWSESVTLEFVKIYLKNECLWNPTHPGYKLRTQREKCYWDIISEFRESTSKTLTLPEVKTKIKNLRTTYVEQVHKIIQRSNPDNIYEPSLVWFHEMDKYLKHIPNKRQQAMYNNLHESSEVDSSWVDQEMPNENLEQNNPDPLIPQVDVEFTPTNNGQRHRLKKGKTFSSVMKKKKIKKYKPEVPIQDDVTDSSTTESTAMEDEFDIYGKFIASQLRTLDLQKALRVQLAIQNLVSEARLSDLSSD